MRFIWAIAAAVDLLFLTAVLMDINNPRGPLGLEWPRAAFLFVFPLFFPLFISMRAMTPGSTIHEDFLYAAMIPYSSAFYPQRLGEIRPSQIIATAIHQYPHFSVLYVRGRGDDRALFNSESAPRDYSNALLWLRAQGIEPKIVAKAKAPALVPLPADRLSKLAREAPSSAGVAAVSESSPPNLALDQALPLRRKVVTQRRAIMIACVAWLAALPTAAAWYIAVPGTSDFLLGFVVFGSMFGGPAAAAILLNVGAVESDVGHGTIFGRRLPLRIMWRPNELGSFSVAQVDRAESYLMGQGRKVLVIYGPKGRMASFGGFARRSSYDAAMAWCEANGIEVREKLAPLLA